MRQGLEGGERTIEGTEKLETENAIIHDTVEGVGFDDNGFD